MTYSRWNLSTNFREYCDCAASSAAAPSGKARTSNDYMRGRSSGRIQPVVATPLAREESHGLKREPFYPRNWQSSTIGQFTSRSAKMPLKRPILSSYSAPYNSHHGGNNEGDE